MDLSTVLNLLVPMIRDSGPLQLNICGDIVSFQWIQEIRVDTKDGSYFSFDNENVKKYSNLPGDFLEMIEGEPLDSIEMIGQVRTDEPHIRDWFDHIERGNPTQRFNVRTTATSISAVYTNLP